MITYVTLPKATANIVQLLDRVCQGEEIIISQAGITMVKDRPEVIFPRPPNVVNLDRPDNMKDNLPFPVTSTIPCRKTS